MRILVLSIAALILLAIVIFSVHAGYKIRDISDNNTIQKIGNNSSFPEASKDWGSFKEVTVNSDKLRKSSLNENPTKDLSETHENSIFQYFANS